MQILIQDLRYGARMLMKKRGFTLVAIITLSLGTGANTAIFSLVNAVLLRPLPFAEPERLVMLWEDYTALGFPRREVAPANVVDWKARQSTFEDIATLDWRDFDITGDGEPQKVAAYGVSANLFPLLGIRPVLGRNFTAEEDQPGAANVAILSYGLWQRRYGGEPGIVGRDILLHGEKYRVVGVMPPDFQFLQGYVGLWVPAALPPDQLADRDNHYITVVGRIKPGITVAQAHDDLLTISQDIARAYPKEADGLTPVVVPLHDQLVGEVRRPLLFLLGAVGFVLLIACANIASLLLARAAARRKEIAMRTALGASGWRIIRQLLTESVLLASAGGGAGLLVAVWSFSLLKQLIPESMTASTRLEIDLPVLGYALAVSLLTGVIFGLVPALQASKIDLNEALKQGGASTALSGGGDRLRGAFVVAEVAMALVLLIAAGLLMQTVFNLRDQYAVLQPDKLLTLRTGLARYKYNEHARRVAFYDQVLERVEALPGVIAAGYTTSVPLQWKGGVNSFIIEGRQPQPGAVFNAIHRQVSNAYFQAIGMPLRQGRYFNDGDQRQSLPVAIINETMAREYWPDEDPLGQRFRLGVQRAPWVTVVGVVADFRQMGLDEPVKAEMFFPYRQITTHPWYAPRDLVVRTANDPAGLIGALREAIHAVDPDQPIANIATMDNLLTEETGARRLGMILLSVYAGLALGLAALGLYGVLSYVVAQQTPEIGVRMALGARRGDILGLVIKKGMRWVLFGVALGGLGAAGLTRLMASLLFGVSATDPLTFAGIMLLLTIVALLACWIPARRAMKVDPMTALRCE